MMMSIPINVCVEDYRSLLFRENAFPDQKFSRYEILIIYRTPISIGA